MLLISGIVLLCISFITSNAAIVYFQSLGPETESRLHVTMILMTVVTICGVVGFGLIMFDILKNKYWVVGQT